MLDRFRVHSILTYVYEAGCDQNPGAEMFAGKENSWVYSDPRDLLREDGKDCPHTRRN